MEVAAQGAASFTAGKQTRAQNPTQSLPPSCGAGADGVPCGLQGKLGKHVFLFFGGFFLPAPKLEAGQGEGSWEWKLGYPAYTVCHNSFERKSPK